MAEEDFLRSTPRKIGSLWERHVKFNGWKFKDEDDSDNADREIYNMDDPQVDWFRKLNR